MSYGKAGTLALSTIENLSVLTVSIATIRLTQNFQLKQSNYIVIWRITNNVFLFAR